MNDHAKQGRMTGAEHFRKAEGLLYAAYNENDYNDPRTQAGIGHALLANAAATVLAVTANAVGDSAEITDWANLVQPSAMPAAVFRNRREEDSLDDGVLDAVIQPADDEVDASPKPEHWPPQFGDRWRDGRGDEWQIEATGLAFFVADGTSVPLRGAGAAELLARGPLTLTSRHGSPMPKFWPPQHGDTWVDPKGDKWLCESIRGARPTASGPRYLVCITRQGDDNAEEVNRRFGPLDLYTRPGTTREAEVPF